MSMTTELIKKLREVAKKYYDNNGSNEYEVFKYLHEAATTIEELSAKLHSANMERSSQYYNGGWIPCQERLPEEKDYKSCYENYDGAVLWCDDKGLIGVGWYYESTKQWSDINDNKVGIVLAWRPLPEPYQTNDEEVENADND